MSRYLSAEQHAEIKKLRIDQGMKVREIAKRFSISHATVANVCKGTTAARGCSKPMQRKVNKKMADAKEVVFEDLSKLPDNAFFQHVRESMFIG